MCGLLRSPPFVPVYLCVSVGPRGATHGSACPVLHHSESGPLCLSAHKCGATGSASGQTACPVGPTLRQSRFCHRNASPLRPGLPISAPPTGLDECLFFISLVSDFLAVRFSVSSGCARRRSVSTYAAILVLRMLHILIPCLRSITSALTPTARPPEKPDSVPLTQPCPEGLTFTGIGT